MSLPKSSVASWCATQRNSKARHTGAGHSTTQRVMMAWCVRTVSVLVIDAVSRRGAAGAAHVAAHA